jgi:PAS domain S-box-containing protein
VVALLDHLTDGMFVFDADFCFRYINEPGARMLGRKPEELEGRHAWTEFPEAVGGPSYRAYQEAFRTGRPVEVTEFYAPLGRLFEVRVFPSGEQLMVLFRDITEQRRLEEERQEYAERMAEAERIAGFGVWRWNLATGEVRWSEELHRLFGLPPGEFGGTVDDFVARLPPADRDRIMTAIGTAVEAAQPFTQELPVVRPDGTRRWMRTQGRVLLGSEGRPVEVVGVTRDVTDRWLAERALGMSERRLRAILDNTPSVVAVKDLEGRYLMANAEAGRILGITADELIGRLCTELFPEDVAGQLRANDAIAAAEGRAVFDETVLMDGDEPRSYTTVTFALPDDDGHPIELCTIGTDVTERRERESERRVRQEWEERIASALAEERMLVYAQPIFDAATGAEVAGELLVRMSSPGDRAETLLPAAFLPVAERYGLIQRIDAFVVRNALALVGNRRLAVNLSAVTLCDRRAREEIIGLLAGDRAAASRLTFEITETAALEHIDAASSFAEMVGELGCGLALDDFGTGFGSFTYLRQLPLRYLKIDLSFVVGMVGSEDDRRVVQSIIGIAREFGLRTIAEGVEDEATLQLLREMGADLVQGFHLGRPAPIRAGSASPAAAP